ncbi:hypothetical protein [uncultured Sulfitobacter sp.]|uniref:hypothetical protein n=1 Tax=uncultured Sulfitobacter sp. TaxID=191468 RepID=UPI002633D60B|nr:hypothetical protein [uncultured Sulfitobacter sp.]
MQDDLKKDGHEECPDGEDRDDAMESLSRFLRPRIAEAREGKFSSKTITGIKMDARRAAGL